MKKFLSAIVLSALILTPLKSYSSAVDSLLSLSIPKDFIPLNLASSFLKDKGGVLSFEEVIARKEAFDPIVDEIYNFNKDPEVKVFWVRTSIQNLTKSDLEYLLYLHQGLDSVEFFIISPKGERNHAVYTSYESTRNMPYFISQEIVVPVALQKGITTIYFRIVNRSVWSKEMGSMIISLAEQKSFLNYFLEFRFYQGIALGMLFIILVLYFFLYLFFRDATYLAFLANIFFTLVYLLLRKNYQLEFDFLSPNFSMVKYFHDPACVLISITAIWFSQLFLGVKEKYPVFYIIMNALIILQVCIVIGTLFFQSLRLLNAVSIYLGFLSAIVVIIASVKSYFNGDKLALYVFFGFILLAGVPIIYLIPLPNYLHFRTSESDIHYFGEAFRSIIFAVGIADRFYQLKKEVAQKKMEQKQILFENEKRMQAERERISRDLHDNIGSHLALLTLELSKLSQQLGNNYEIELAKENTKVIIGQLRETVWVLENDKVTIADIGEKLTMLVQSLQKSPTLYVSLEIPESLKTIPLKPSQAINSFRIVQEAIQNIIKHGQCSVIKINFGFDNSTQKIVVQVADNGIGFDQSKALSNGHFGLRNMKRRAEEINGFIEIISTKEKGTVVSLFFPLTQNIPLLV